MKVVSYFCALVMCVTLLSSCTEDDTVEEAVASSKIEIQATGSEENNNSDNGKD